MLCSSCRNICTEKNERVNKNSSQKNDSFKCKKGLPDEPKISEEKENLERRSHSPREPKLKTGSSLFEANNLDTIRKVEKINDCKRKNVEATLKLQKLKPSDIIKASVSVKNTNFHSPLPQETDNICNLKTRLRNTSKVIKSPAVTHASKCRNLNQKISKLKNDNKKDLKTTVEILSKTNNSMTINTRLSQLSGLSKIETESSASKLKSKDLSEVLGTNKVVNLPNKSVKQCKYVSNNLNLRNKIIENNVSISPKTNVTNGSNIPIINSGSTNVDLGVSNKTPIKVPSTLLKISIAPDGTGKILNISPDSSDFVNPPNKSTELDTKSLNSSLILASKAAKKALKKAKRKSIKSGASPRYPLMGGMSPRFSKLSPLRTTGSVPLMGDSSPIKSQIRLTPVRLTLKPSLEVSKFSDKIVEKSSEVVEHFDSNKDLTERKHKHRAKNKKKRRESKDERKHKLNNKENFVTNGPVEAISSGEPPKDFSRLTPEIPVEPSLPAVIAETAGKHKLSLSFKRVSDESNEYVTCGNSKQETEPVPEKLVKTVPITIFSPSENGDNLSDSFMTNNDLDGVPEFPSRCEDKEG